MEPTLVHKLFKNLSMMNKKLALVTVITLVLNSCTIYRTINFNDDKSGSMENKIDMTSMVSMMGQEGGGMGSMGDMAQIEQSKTLLEAVPGITNVTVTYDTTGIMYTNYNFASVDALNKAMGVGGGNNMNMLGGSTEGTGDTGGKSKIVYKGKKFYMEEVDKKTLQSIQKGEKKEEMAQMEMMMGSSSIITTINFPTEIKKVSYKNASITNGKTVSYTTPIKDLISKDYKPLTINLK